VKHRTLAALLAIALLTGLTAWALPWGSFWLLATGLVVGAGLARLAAVRSGGTGATRKTEVAPLDPLATLADFAETLTLPVLAIDSRLTVRIANRASRQAFPALRSGEPMSFALRDPALVAGVQASLADGAERSVDLHERVPVERAFACALARFTLTGKGTQPQTLVSVLVQDRTQQRAVEAMRVDFIANASHELRTPLTAILGSAETLQGPARNDPAARDRFLGLIAEQGRRMARLVDDLLSLSRIELKERQAPQGHVDLAAIAREAANTLSGLATDRDVTVEVLPPTTPTLVIGERDELLSVLDNLIENAIKYGHSGKRVEIAFGGGKGKDVTVSVRDFGPGIAAEHLPRLTERFYRIDNALSRAEGGTGLGLALVKHTVNRHRGRLSIQSTPGAGATFTISLPCAPASEGP